MDDRDFAFELVQRYRITVEPQQLGNMWKAHRGDPEHYTVDQTWVEAVLAFMELCVKVRFE